MSIFHLHVIIVVFPCTILVFFSFCTLEHQRLHPMNESPDFLTPAPHYYIQCLLIKDVISCCGIYTYYCACTKSVSCWATIVSEADVIGSGPCCRMLQVNKIQKGFCFPESLFELYIDTCMFIIFLFYSCILLHWLHLLDSPFIVFVLFLLGSKILFTLQQEKKKRKKEK